MDTINIKFTASTGYVGSETSVVIEFDYDYWINMSDSERWDEAISTLQSYGLEINWFEEEE